jgi:predicted DNA-binding transcriptional regulator AlpA
MNENQFPHPDQLISTYDLEQYTDLKPRFWEARRISGDTPPYIYISKRAVRYRWGDVQEWLNSKKRHNTADMEE